MKLGRPLLRNRLVQICAGGSAGIALGLLVGSGAVEGIDLRSDVRRPAPRPLEPVIAAAGAGATDPLAAREAGRSMASALKVTTIARCNRLEPMFRAGCRDYVRVQARRARR